MSLQHTIQQFFQKKKSNFSADSCMRLAYQLAPIAQQANVNGSENFSSRKKMTGSKKSEAGQNGKDEIEQCKAWRSKGGIYRLGAPSEPLQQFRQLRPACTNRDDDGSSRSSRRPGRPLLAFRCLSLFSPSLLCSSTPLIHSTPRMRE
jgi:hypothetical protein